MVNSPRLTPQRSRVENGQDSSLPLSTQHVRRSPRFSGSVTSEPGLEEVATLRETEKDDEAKIQSRPETPENDSANDEPSSVLASRIMRSHTNPSPPPDLPDTRQEEPLITLVDDNVLDTPSRTGQEMLPDTPTPCATLALPNNSPLFLPTGEGSVADPLALLDAKVDKLDVFPADNLFSHPARRHASPAPPSPMGVAVSTLPTLDASCEPNPTEPLTLPRELQTAEGSPGSTTDEEIDVADALISSESIHPTDPTASTSELPPVQVVGPQTPVRTSSRPRKSVAMSSPPSPSKRKGKRKSLAGVETAQESTPQHHHLSGRREVSPLRTKMKEMARSSRRPVDSLSPGTVGLLGQIVSNTPSPLLDVAQSDTSDFRFPTTFPALTDLQPPRSPSRSPSPNRTSSTSSHTLRLHDVPNQSPARRVPIAEVRDRGHNSPLKQANGQVMTLRVQPTDSPARRVAPNVPNTPRGAARPPALVFGKPLSSPIRSRSVEPPVVVRTKPVARSGSAEPVARQLPFPLKPVSSRIPSSIPEEKETNDETVPLPSSTMPQSSKSVLRQHTPSKIPRLKPYARPRVSTTSNSNQSKAPNRKLEFTSTSTWTSTPSNPAAAAAEVALQLKLAEPSTPQASGLKRKHDDIDLPPTTSTLRTANASSPTKSSLSVDIPRMQRTGITHATMVEPPHNHAASSNDLEVNTDEVECSSTTRRTARPRRLLPQGAHTFPKPSTQPATLSEPRQRKPPAVRTGPNLFRGLTPLAINSMTRTNTAKNEQYQTAQLETEVIRREGSRPESPVMKVKTRSQKEQDDKSKNRRLRAERRAQRLDSGSGDGEPLPSNGAEEESVESVDIDAPGSPIRHRRGPGDEEDYVTPDRPPPQKRVRLDHDDDGGGVRNVKMVKWDKGLSKTIFVDEIEIGNWKRSKEIPSIKSCLAPSAKSLRLDPLGNLAGPSPLPDLAKENVTVKKIVYDSDVGVLQPVEPAKNTRSRSKKSS